MTGLDALTASDTKMIKNVDASAQQGVQLAFAKTNEADQHSIDASKRARAVQLTATPGESPTFQRQSCSAEDRHSYIIEERGFARGRGQSAIGTSQKMANSVVRDLVLILRVGLSLFVVGIGNAPVAAEDGTPAKHAGSGWVEITL